MAKLLRLPAVIALTGSNSTEIYDGMKRGSFPQSVPLGKRTVAWVEDEIQTWIEQRIAQRDRLLPHTREQQRRRKGGPGRGHKGPISPIGTEL